MKILLILISLVYILIYSIRLQFPEVDIEVDLFNSTRMQISERLAMLLPSPQAQLLDGILLGSKNEMPHKFQLALRDTSVLHMVVVSGQNITLLAVFVLGMLAGFIKRRLALIITLAVVLVYVLIAGAQIPVLRAALMAGIVFLGQYVGRQRDGVIALFASGLTLLLINPDWIQSVSFQLSFLATFGVVVVAPVLMKSIFKSLPNIIKQDLSVTVGAQLMVLPIISIYFHQVSLIGIFSNLLVGWTIPFIMVIGTFVVLMSFIFMPFAQVFAWLVNILLTYFVYVVEFFVKLPFAWEYVGDFNILFWVGYYLLLLGMVQLLYAENATTRGPEESPENTGF